MRRLRLAIIVLGAAVVLGAGAFALPATRTARASAVLDAPVARVFAVVSDAAGQAGWRRDVKAVEMAADGTSWREHLAHGGSVDVRLVTRDPGRRFEIAFASERGFSGTWTGDFVEDSGRTRLDIVETVTVPGVFNRVVGRLIGMPDAHVAAYLEDLEKALAAP